MALTTFSGPVVSQNGFLDSSFTTAERDAIVDPQPGLLIYNTTVNEYQVYNGTSWQPAFGPPPPPPAPVATYVQGVAYDFPGVTWNKTGALTGQLNVDANEWNSFAWQIVVNRPIGTTFSYIDQATSQTITSTIASTFAFNPGVNAFSGSITFSSTPSASIGGPYAVSSITI
jgi:hypothetical protein